MDSSSTLPLSDLSDLSELSDLSGRCADGAAPGRTRGPSCSSTLDRVVVTVASIVAACEPAGDRDASRVRHVVLDHGRRAHFDGVPATPVWKVMECMVATASVHCASVIS